MPFEFKSALHLSTSTSAHKISPYFHTIFHLLPPYQISFHFLPSSYFSCMVHLSTNPFIIAFHSIVLLSLSISFLRMFPSQTYFICCFQLDFIPLIAYIAFFIYFIPTIAEFDDFHSAQLSEIHIHNAHALIKFTFAMLSAHKIHIHNAQLS